jgi:hypothetical protein
VADQPQNLSQQIPPPGIVRERLAENLREARFLRSLLRVSERAAAVQQNRQTVRNAGDNDDH